jgi:hypothetical protein
MDLPSAELEYNALDRSVVISCMPIVHDANDLICITLEEGFFSGEQVILVGVDGDFVVNAKTLLVIEQKCWESLLTTGLQETFDDIMTDVCFTVGSFIVQAYINDTRRHGDKEVAIARSG